MVNAEGRRRKQLAVSIRMVSFDVHKIISGLSKRLQMSFTYGATKAFVKYLIKSMAYEHSVSGNAKRSKIDLLNLQPGMVKTKMIKRLEDMGKAIAVVSTEECVEAALNDLGNGKHCTFGASAHHKFIRVLEVFVKYANPLVNNRKYRKKKEASDAK